MRVDSPPESPELAPETPIDDIPEVEVATLQDQPRQHSPRIPPKETRQAKTPAHAEYPEIPPSDGPVILNVAEAFAAGKNGQAADEIVKVDEATITPMKFDMEAVTSRWKDVPAQRLVARELARKVARKDTAKTLANEIVLDPDPESNPEELLSRVIQKDDFEHMEILGQFNLGFIIVRSRRLAKGLVEDPSMDIDGMDGGTKEPEIDDLFIVDQHAADEKYNFETLQLTTRIESQKLIRARPLDFSASDRMVALENLGVLQGNGFELEVEGEGAGGDEEEDEGGADEEGRDARRLVLVSQPISKSTVFDMSGQSRSPSDRDDPLADWTVCY
jgi:DNA mismatch repair protein PMS2